MPIRISGMNSGLDTDSIVKELVSAYSTKKDTYTKAQTKLSWKQDAWKGLNTKIYSLYNNVGKLRFDSAYAVKKATTSDATKANVSAASNAVAGTYSIKIKQLATAGYLTGAKITDQAGGKVTANTKLSELGFDTTEEGIISVKVGDKTKDISVTKDTTVNDFVKELGNAGVNASFDANHGRFYISSKNTGKENDFTILGDNKAGSAVLSKLGLVTNQEIEKQKEAYGELKKYTDPASIQNTIKANQESISKLEAKDNILNMGIAYGDALISENNYKAKGSAEDWTNLTTLMNKADATDEEKTQLKSLQEKFGFMKEGTDAEELDTDKWNAFVKEQELIQTVKGNVAKLAEKGTLTDDEQFYKDICERVDAANVAGTVETTEAINARILIITKGEENASSFTKQLENNSQEAKRLQNEIDSYPLVTADMTEDELTALQEKAKYAEEMLADNKNFAANVGATRINGQDAQILVNGAEYNGTSNSLSINGLTINATAVTGDNEFTVTVSSDSQGIYDSVKDFLSEYNSLINEMTKLYNAASSKGYEPLTDDEKDAMSDSEIEKWETKIKDSLFRRDTTLNGVMNAMKTAMSSMYEVNGQKYSLTNFGISTLGFMNSAENEQNAYHIDGDEDDSTTSGKTDKLMKAINEDPDAIVEFMKQLSKSVYSALDDKMKSSDLSSAYKVYNDKEMDKQYKEYTSLISKWEDKITDKEDYYYKKFSAMESAMAKLDSQTSSLSSLFGM